MTIIAANFSTQALINLVVTYMPSSGIGPDTYSMNLGPRNLITNIGTVGAVPNSAASCLNIIIQTSLGPITIPFGQSQPMPIPIGFNLLVGWASSESNVVISMIDMEGGMTQ